MFKRDLLVQSDWYITREIFAAFWSEDDDDVAKADMQRTAGLVSIAKRSMLLIFDFNWQPVYSIYQLSNITVIQFVSIPLTIEWLRRQHWLKIVRIEYATLAHFCRPPAENQVQYYSVGLHSELLEILMFWLVFNGFGNGQQRFKSIAGQFADKL